MESTPPLAPVYRLYSPGQVALAAFLGGPFAACWLLYRNCHRLGQARRARHCLIWGAVGTVALTVCTLFLPERFPSMALPAGYTIGLYQTAHHMHGDIVSAHRSAGGRLGSWWAVIGIALLGVLCILTLFAVQLGIVTALPESWIAR